MAKELGETWRQQDEVDVLVSELEVLGCQMAEAFRGRAEQQG